MANDQQVQDRQSAPDNPSAGRVFGQEVITVADTGLRKKGIIVEPADSREFEVRCDEGVHLGGDCSAPRPITYFLLSVGFCALTQLHRYGEMMKVDLRNCRVTVKSKFRTDGSVLKGTVQAMPFDFQIKFEVESDDPTERVAACIDNAERGCFVMQAIVNPIPVAREVLLNGKALGAA
jgi:uncharacterized OsmC-like protein